MGCLLGYVVLGDNVPALLPTAKGFFTDNKFLQVFLVETICTFLLTIVFLFLKYPVMNKTQDEVLKAFGIALAYF